MKEGRAMSNGAASSLAEAGPAHRMSTGGAHGVPRSR